MKRALILAAIFTLSAATGSSGGRANYVHHFDDRGEKFIFASAGSCRHHLSAHPGDSVMTTFGPSQDPANCN